jgi:hypothetical protein
MNKLELAVKDARHAMELFRLGVMSAKEYGDEVNRIRAELGLGPIAAGVPMRGSVNWTSYQPDCTTLSKGYSTENS